MPLPDAIAPSLSTNSVLKGLMMVRYMPEIPITNAMSIIALIRLSKENPPLFQLILEATNKLLLNLRFCHFLGRIYIQAIKLKLEIDGKVNGAPGGI